MRSGKSCESSVGRLALTRSSTSAGPATTWTSFARQQAISWNSIQTSFWPSVAASFPIPGGTDPVGRGYAESLARPGSNVTGFATMELSVIGKMLQTLKEIVPHVARVSMIYNPDNPGGAFAARAFESAAAPLGIEGPRSDALRAGRSSSAR